MDIVLSIADTFIFDRLYAAALPVQSYAAGNTTTPLFTQKPIEIDPVSEHFGWAPSQYAYLSRLPRDNDIRQVFSLFLITW
ncbi:C-5 sterol desaturase [Pyronema omphalodes]|jgi:lathosterol oxidase|nr:C-5 sterol desaturase [Pyronema omphalodes]